MDDTLARMPNTDAVTMFVTMLDRAYALSSTTEAFDEKCDKFCSIFSRLYYSWSLIDSVVSNFVSRKPSVGTAERNADESNIRTQN